MRETCDFMSLPLWVRPNTVLPVGSRNDRPDYDYSDGVLLKVFQLESGKRMRVEIPNLTGNVETSFNVQREGAFVRIQRQGPPKPWKILLVKSHSIETSETTEQSSEGLMILPENSTNAVEIKILAV